MILQPDGVFRFDLPRILLMWDKYREGSAGMQLRN